MKTTKNLTNMKAPKTIEDYKKVLKTVIELMGNPFCDHLMFDSLLRKKEAAQNKIEELTNMKKDLNFD